MTDEFDAGTRFSASGWFWFSSWVLLAAGGMAALERYEHRPGESASAPSAWPADLEAQLGVPSTKRWNLLLFAHPKCPCTQATLENLDRLVARCGDRLAVRVVFFQDPRADSDWIHSPNYDRATAIPAVDVVVDPGGALASRFGAKTSGDTLLYDIEGSLRFRGGLTAARGHAGDSPGTDAIESLVRSGSSTSGEAEVFGCSLECEEIP